ncbi:hypothetical protein [Shouchella patagoniensis]|uniref:hypothetical protein n=1 Tax=Shouchella patagoniensis TaxID=228576 RepID=UPI000995A0C6|nr:hypothetical protein [Shouchella patagoniensis]
MKSLDVRILALSSAITLLLIFIVPSSYLTEGKGSYEFGFLFPMLTIYQETATSHWFLINVFSEHDGILVSIPGAIANIVLFYLLLQFSKKRIARKNAQRKHDSALPH